MGMHRAHHYRGAPRADTGKKSGSRRRVVPDQASSCPIVGNIFGWKLRRPKMQVMCITGSTVIARNPRADPLATHVATDHPFGQARLKRLVDDAAAPAAIPLSWRDGS